jgi:hypothetical protein
VGAAPGPVHAVRPPARRRPPGPRVAPVPPVRSRRHGGADAQGAGASADPRRTPRPRYSVSRPSTPTTAGSHPSTLPTTAGSAATRWCSCACCGAQIGWDGDLNL